MICRHKQQDNFCEIEQAYIPQNWCAERCNKAKLPRGRRMAYNFGKALIRHAQNRTERTQQEQERILAVCRACDNYIMVDNQPRCKDYNCGCFLERKVKWDSENCPHCKWYPFQKNLFINANGDNLNLADVYSGQPIIFILNGSSVKDLDIDKIKQSGIKTFGVNNGGIIKPDFVSLQDSPSKFKDDIWLNCNITKFTDINNSEKTIPNGLAVKDCPSVIYHRRATDLDVCRWFSKYHISWGDHEDYRNSMLAMIHISFCLGFNKIYLLGADFKMNKEQPYFFDEQKGDGGVRHNNALYQRTEAILKKALPLLKTAGLDIINCTPNSGLTAFGYKDINEVINEGII